MKKLCPAKSLPGTVLSCEDFALMRSIPGMVVMSPADDVEAKAAVKAAYAHHPYSFGAGAIGRGGRGKRGIIRFPIEPVFLECFVSLEIRPKGFARE